MLTIALVCALFFIPQDGKPLHADVALYQPLATGAALDATTFEAYRDLIAPSTEDEAWRAIPWRATFWQGVVDAQVADRPVLLFTMNGHPFGCT